MHTEEKQHHEHTDHHAHEATHATHHKKGADSIRVSKKTLGAIALVIVLVLLAQFGRTAIFAVTVNGSPITRFEVMRGLEQSSGKAYVESLITEKLIAAQARKEGVRVTDADVASDIAKIEEGLSAQGATLDMLLSSQGMTREGLTKQIGLKLMLEKLLAEKIAVTEEEVDTYIAEAKIEIEEDKKEEMRATIMEQLKGQKLNKEAGAYIDGLRGAAHTKYFGMYVPAVPTTLPTAQ